MINIDNHITSSGREARHTVGYHVIATNLYFDDARIFRGTGKATELLRFR